jgi:hypothetical protein
MDKTNSGRAAEPGHPAGEGESGPKLIIKSRNALAGGAGSGGTYESLPV